MKKNNWEVAIDFLIWEKKITGGQVYIQELGLFGEKIKISIKLKKIKEILTVKKYDKPEEILAKINAIITRERLAESQSRQRGFKL